MKKKRLTNRERMIRRFVRNIEQTWKNKLGAIIFVITASVPMILDGDATAFVMALMFAIPLFFTTKKVIC